LFALKDGHVKFSVRGEQNRKTVSIIPRADAHASAEATAAA